MLRSLFNVRPVLRELAVDLTTEDLMTALVPLKREKAPAGPYSSGLTERLAKATNMIVSLSRVGEENHLIVDFFIGHKRINALKLVEQEVISRKVLRSYMDDVFRVRIKDNSRKAIVEALDRIFNRVLIPLGIGIPATVYDDYIQSDNQSKAAAVQNDRRKKTLRSMR